MKASGLTRLLCAKGWSVIIVQHEVLAGMILILNS